MEDGQTVTDLKAFNNQQHFLPQLNKPNMTHCLLFIFSCQEIIASSDNQSCWETQRNRAANHRHNISALWGETVWQQLLKQVGHAASENNGCRRSFLPLTGPAAGAASPHSTRPRRCSHEGQQCGRADRRHHPNHRNRASLSQGATLSLN